MQKNELAKKITLFIEDLSVPLWFPNLAIHLTKIGWQTLKNDFGLTPSTYGTARILLGNVNTPLSVIPLKDKSSDTVLSIELLPKELKDNYSDLQIDFYNSAQLSEQPIWDCLREAIELIKTVPSLWESVFILVKTLHLIRLVDDDYDVSFSEPQLPFSVFISVPKNRIKADFLRVSEAIVHETMHLQLSLIEKVVPLIKSNEQKFYSPWKDEYRNSTGILHALYVFRVIESFYKHLELQHCLSPFDLDFTKKRKNEILLQANKIKKFSRSSDLTEKGLQFTKRLLC